MGKEEEKGARPVQKDNSSGKALLLEPRDSVRGAAASQQDDVIDDAGSKECEQFHYDTKEMYQFLETIKGMKDNPQCVDCQRGATAENLTLQERKLRLVMCSGCSQCFCARLVSNEDGPMGHAQLHAKSACHPVALCLDQPDAAYCFQCDHSLSLKPIALAARSRKHGYVVRGIPNSRGRCYINSPLQCLLALDDLWMLMLGPHAPAGPIGVALKEFFLETRSGNAAGANMNPRKLLDSICPLDGRYRTTDHQDCQEFLVHLRNGLIEEELQARLPDVRKDVPTVVDSIFKGEVSIIKGMKDDPQCVDCQRGATAENLTLQEAKPRFVMCSSCSQCFCAALVSNEDGPMGHARLHAKSACHPVALWIDQPVAAYCFLCDHSLSLKPIPLAARSHKHGCVVRGMPNCRDKCHVNALVQCLLALDDLWMSMLGPHAPAGSLGLALKELFLETRAGNDAGATLNTDKLLESICKLDERCMTSDHQDCQEFLVHLRNGLIEEELLERLPDVQKDVRTVVDSIFRGEVSIMWTYKRCLHTADKDEEFYELSLPLPPKEHPTKSVPASQRHDRRKAADTVKRSRQIQKEEEKKAAASLPSIKQCLDHYFTKDEVQKRCEICEKPSTSQSKDGGQMVAIISESTSLDRAQAERDHHGKVEEKNDMWSDQDRTKQVELENTAQQVPDVIREIASRLPCDLAISQMAYSGPSWADALSEVGFHVPEAHARLPWLLMPHPGGPVFLCISCGGGDSVRHTIGIAEDKRWARYVGAFEGLWMVAAGTRIGGNMIFNLRSGTSFLVPNQAVHGGSVQQLLLLATTLSSAPDKQNCMGMGIIKYMANLQQSRRVVFFTPGNETAIDHFPGEYFDEPEDLTYHESSFWLLTTNEHVHRWDMTLQPDGDITLERWHGFFFHEHLDHGDHIVGRYIVPSRGELLMVVRLSSYSYGAGGETTKFRIYKMTVVDMGEGEDDPVRCRWNELGSLAGRMLFIGRGCSRCYEASDYPRLTEGVYFCDGRTSFYAEGIVNNLEVPCSDTGRWSTQTSIDRCFPQEYNFSSYSSSGWVLQ